MKIRLAIIIGILLLISIGFVVAQDDYLYFPTNYEYPNPNTMTNDISLNTYYYKTNELSPMYANGEWGYHFYDEDGKIIDTGHIVTEIEAYEVVGYPDYVESWDYEAYAESVFYEKYEYFRGQGFSNSEAAEYAQKYVDDMNANPDAVDVLLEITDAEFSKKVGYYNLKKLVFFNNEGVVFSLAPTTITLEEDAQNYVGGYFETTAIKNDVEYTFSGKFTDDFLKLKNGIFYESTTREENQDYPGNYTNAVVTTWTAVKPFSSDDEAFIKAYGDIEMPEGGMEEDTGSDDGEETAMMKSPVEASGSWNYYMFGQDDMLLYSQNGGLEIAVVEEGGKYILKDARFFLGDTIGYIVLEETELVEEQVGGDTYWKFEAEGTIQVDIGGTDTGDPAMSSTQNQVFTFTGYFDETFSVIWDPNSSEYDRAYYSLTGIDYDMMWGASK
jgi:hypothetical protein